MKFSESIRCGKGEVAARIIEGLPRILPSLKLESVQLEPRTSGQEVPDIILRARAGNLRKDILVEVKSPGEPRLAMLAIAQLRRAAKHWPNSYLVFAAPYISERTRELCKSEGVGYLDLSGDAYLEFGSVLVDRVGAEGRVVEKRRLKSLFAPKATRVVRALLEAPDKPVHIASLAQSCRMSLGRVYLVIRELEDRGFIERGKGKSITVSEPQRLLAEWAQNWSLVKKNVLEYYFSFDRGPEHLIPKISEAATRLDVQYALTGMAGASFIAPFVRYDDVWAYVGEGEERIVKDLDLRPVSSGANVVLVRPYDTGVFASAHEVRGSRIVSNIQLYVDLYNYPARGREQAEALFSQAIRFPEGQ